MFFAIAGGIRRCLHVKDILTEAAERGINPKALAISKTTEKALEARKQKGAPDLEKSLEYIKKKLNL